jgi:hypothetical protein
MGDIMKVLQITRKGSIIEFFVKFRIFICIYIYTVFNF